MSISTPLPGTTIDPLYPDSDGEPLGETQFHILAILHLHDALGWFYCKRTDVCVAADLFMYYEEGNEVKSKAPDVMVAFGVQGNHPRRSFRISEEGVVPAVIFEITSEKTHAEDEHGKKETYAQLGVREYFLFDPEDLSLDPRLQGFRLRDEQYVALSPDADGRLVCQELGMLLKAEDSLLRLIDSRTGERLMTLKEAIEAAIEAKRETETERQRVTDLEAEIARLRAAAERSTEE